jgi:hypothetical protein
MADDADFSIDATPSLQDLATFLADELFNVQRIARLETAMTNAHQKGATVANAAEVQAAPALAEKKESLATQGYDTARKAVAWGLANIIAHLLGIEAPADLFNSGHLRPQDSAIGQALGKTIIGGIAGESGELVPGDEAATRFMGMLAHLTIQSWAEGILVEELTSLHGILHPIEEISKLGQELINGMGLNRLARVAMRPLAQTLVATPLDWKYKKQFRPNLLSEGEIISAFKRGDYDGAEAGEELARLGYTDRRQDMLLKSATKRLSTDDVQVLRRVGTLARDYALQNLRDQGYDEQTAEYLVLAAEERRLTNIRDNSLPSIIRAYVNRDITQSEFDTLLPAVVPDDAELGFTREFARTELELNIKHMSQGEVLDALDHLILPIAFYRDWLRREGFPEDEATALELLYIAKRNEKADVAAERTRIAAEKADEKAARDAERQKRQTELEAQRALHARGSISDLRRAYARGLMPRDRLAEVLTAQYDGDTVGILLADADVDRATYVAEQQRADDAKKRAAQRNIDVGALEQAVLHHVLTVQAYADALTARGFAAGDVVILAKTLAAKLADQDAAQKQRAQAAAAAAVKRIDLARFENLVRHGLRALSDYDALLASLGYDDGSRAGMVDLLNAQVADDAKARKLRDAAAAKAATKELSLEQFRRAVILGVKSDGDFQSFLVKQGYTADAQAVLVAELRRDVADAESARHRRAAAEAAKAVVDLPLSRVTAAARLGVVTPDAYRERLAKRGYSDDDIAIEMELLLVEIADTQAARAKREALAAGTEPTKELSLAQLADAVKRGTAPIADYRTAAAALYEPEDVDLLVATLTAEAQTHADARARHDGIATELEARGLSLAEFEGQVKAGTLAIAAYKAQLQTWGYGKDDAQLLAALLV